MKRQPLHSPYDPEALVNSLAVNLDHELCALAVVEPCKPLTRTIYLDGRGMSMDLITGTVAQHESRWVKLSDGTMCNVTLERVEWQN